MTKKSRTLQSAILTRQGERGLLLRHTHILANPDWKRGDVLLLLIYQTKRIESWSLVFAGDPISSHLIAWWDKPASMIDDDDEE